MNAGNEIEQTKNHILVISDEPLALAETKKGLISDFHVSIASNHSTALNSLQTLEHAAIIICIGKDTARAFSIFEKLSSFAKSTGIPIIVLDEVDRPENSKTAVEMGCADYTVRELIEHDALIKRVKQQISKSKSDSLPASISHDTKSPDPSGAEERNPTTPRMDTPISTETDMILMNKTILVAEDTALIRTIIDAVFAHFKGLNMMYATNGIETVEMFAKSPEVFSFILMDVEMPIMDGLEATRAIRNMDIKSAKEIPIFAHTAATEPAEFTKCIDAGMNEVLQKPIELESLLKLIRKHNK